MLLKHLGERGHDSGIAAAVAVSVPYDLAGCAARLSGGLAGRTYGSHFLRALKRKVRAKRGLLADAVDVERVLAARTLIDYDDALTAPLHGFAGADDYYDRADARRHLADIRVPTLLLQSRDDPFLREGTIPEAAAAANPHIMAASHRPGRPSRVRGRSLSLAPAFLGGADGGGVSGGAPTPAPAGRRVSTQLSPGSPSPLSPGSPG